MAKLHQRLDWCREVGGLTTANLALWLNAPYETVKGWVDRGHFPLDHRVEEVFKRLEALELAINEAVPGQLIPYEVRQRDRRDYLRGLYAQYAKRCSLIERDNP